MLFVSYSSKDEAAVRDLVGDLERARFEVWLDEELRGGDVWWDEILGRIRGCDVFLFALSTNSRQSKPCQAELQYARDLGLPVLPVQIGQVDHIRTLAISDLQIVPYTERSIPNALGLVSAVQDRAKAPKVPRDPPPDPPPVPYAYLLRLSSAIEAPFLTVDEQAELIRQLRTGLEDEEDEGVREDVRQLLRELRSRGDLTVRNAADIDAVLAAVAAPAAAAPAHVDPPPAQPRPEPESTPPADLTARPDPGRPEQPVQPVQPVQPAVAAVATPPGWYRDPSGRSAYRYWDGQGWTEQASDGAHPQVPAPAAPAHLAPPPPKPGNPWSITAIVLGIIAVLLVPIVFGPGGIICAVVGKNKGERLWRTGLWVSILGMIVGIVINAIVLSQMQV